MPAIHLIERGIHPKNLRQTNKEKSEWESGFWVVADETAKKLIGGHIYLHHGQDVASHFGGEIVNYYIQQTGDESGRVVFQFVAGKEFKGIKTDRTGWGNEKKIVW